MMLKSLIFSSTLFAAAAAAPVRHLQADSELTDWYVEFLTAEATFDNSGEPEIFFSFNAPAPDGDVKYYEVEILSPLCENYVLPTDDAAIVTPYGAEGRIPNTNWNAADSTLSVALDIDTTLIAASEIYYSAGASAELFSIDFCVQVNLHNELGLVTATENTIVTFNVDTSQTFEINDLQAQAEDATEANEDAVIDFPLLVYFCDANGDEITPDTLFPGEVLTFCVEADSTAAVVTNLRVMEYLNTLDATMIIPLIDIDSNPTNQQTTMECEAGKCRVETIAFAALYARRNADGTVTDISAGVNLSGTAVLEFGVARRLGAATSYDTMDGRALQTPGAGETAVTEFGLDVELAPPPPENSAATSMSLAKVALIGLFGIALL